MSTKPETNEQTIVSRSNRQIGWVIRRNLRSYTGCKVYLSKPIAERYAKGGEVVPAYIEE